MSKRELKHRLDELFSSSETTTPDRPEETAASPVMQAPDVAGALEELRESEARKRAILESALDCIISIDHEGKIIEFNPAAEKTFGYTRDAAMGREMAELIIPPSLRQQHRRGLAHYLATGEGPVLGKRIEITAMRADGSEFPVELAITPIHLGQHPVFTASIRDITERKRAEEALLDIKERFQQLVEHSGDAFFLHDRAGRILEVSQQACDSLGYTREELLNLWLQDIVPPYKPSDPDEWGDGVYPGVKITSEGVHRRKDGTLFPVEARISAFESGGRKLVLALCRDVTERKRAEEERERLLADLESRAVQLQTAAAVSQSASSILDLDELLPTTTELIRSRFNLYYVGIFLVDAAGQYAVLRAGSGEAGRLMVERSHRLAVGGASMIGGCVANHKARIALDVGEEAVRFNNPALPETRSELALPLISRGQTLGAMTVQSAREAAFSEVDIAVLQTMADQVANAIANARLYEQAQAALAEAHRLAQREQLINQLAGKMRAAVSVDEVLRIASDELRRATHATRATARLSAPARANGNGQSASGSQRETTPPVGVTDER